MFRSRLLTFVALATAHAAASFVTLCGAYETGVTELLFWGMFMPMHLLGQTTEGHPDLGSFVGVPEDSPYSPLLFVSVNSLLWVSAAYGLWLGGRWVHNLISSGRRQQAYR
jgi:hypothetical protein